MNNSVLVAGLGNPIRGDDAAGLLAARALREMDAGCVDIEEYEGDVTRLAESMARHRHVIVIDAVRVDAEPGTVLKLTPGQTAVQVVTSSHGFGLRDAIALANVLGGNPTVEVIGIAAVRFHAGAAPSAAVIRAAGQVALEIEERFACA